MIETEPAPADPPAPPRYPNLDEALARASPPAEVEVHARRMASAGVDLAVETWTRILAELARE